MATYQTGNPRAVHNPLRSIPLFQSAGRAFGPSPADRLTGAFRVARDAVRGWTELYAAACAKLGRANTHNREWRRKSQAEAFRELNRVRAGMRANYRALDAAMAALLALGVSVAAL